MKESSLQNQEPPGNISEKMRLGPNQFSVSITGGTVKTKPKEQLMPSQVKGNGDDNISFLTYTTSLFAKRLLEMRHGRALNTSVLHRRA